MSTKAGSTINFAGSDVIDVRDIIARVEELRELLEDYENKDGDLELHDENLANQQELEFLEEALLELAGHGGDEQWEGDWYPVILITDHYFTEYAKGLAEECGMYDSNASWPMCCIDWDEAASQLQLDYSGINIAGTTFLYR